MGLSRRFADSPGPFLRAENSATISGFPHDLLSRSLGWMRGSRASRSGRRALGCTTTASGLSPGTLPRGGAGQLQRYFLAMNVYLPSSSFLGSVQMMEHLPDSVNLARTSPFLVVVTAQTSLLS